MYWFTSPSRNEFSSHPSRPYAGFFPQICFTYYGCWIGMAKKKPTLMLTYKRVHVCMSVMSPITQLQHRATTLATPYVRYYIHVQGKFSSFSITQVHHCHGLSNVLQVNVLLALDNFPKDLRDLNTECLAFLRFFVGRYSLIHSTWAHYPMTMMMTIAVQCIVISISIRGEDGQGTDRGDSWPPKPPHHRHHRRQYYYLTLTFHVFTMCTTRNQMCRLL